MCSADEIIGVSRRMLALGLVTETFGNVSCRLEDGLLITPSSVDYNEMSSNDLVLLRPSGDVVEGDRPPSSEYRLHVAIYRRLPGIRAIVHTHSRRAVEYAASADELGSIGSGLLSGPVPIATYRPPGTQGLADGAAWLLVETGTNAVILRDHGVVGVGRNLEEALQVCVEVERQAAAACRRSEEDG